MKKAKKKQKNDILNKTNLRKIEKKKWESFLETLDFKKIEKNDKVLKKLKTEEKKHYIF